MRTLRLDVSYDGTDFQGFAPQPGRRTVGGELGAAAARVLGHPVGIVPGGRTDAGVHALGQVVSLKTTSGISSGELKRALNALVGEDLVIDGIAEADGAFDAGRDARSRKYSYAVWNAAERSVLHRRWAVHVPDPLDVDVMDGACQALLGKHDFAAFRTHRTQDDPNRSTLREIKDIRWRRDAGEARLVRFEVEADGFLRHMVRSIVGTALRVGLRKAPDAWIAQALESRDRAVAGPTAPAAGLTLMEITY